MHIREPKKKKKKMFLLEEALPSLANPLTTADRRLKLISKGQRQQKKSIELLSGHALDGLTHL